MAARRCIECECRIDPDVEEPEWFVDGPMCQACFKQCSDAVCSFENQRRITDGAEVVPAKVRHT